MKGRALLVASAVLAGTVAVPAFAAGTNEKNPDSYATGMTGTGSNAMDPNAQGSMVVVPGTTYVTPAPGTTYVAPAAGTTYVAPAPSSAAVGNIIAPAGTVA